MINHWLVKFLSTLKVKKILIKSGIINHKKIFVNGIPRCDYSFRLRKIKPKGKLIVYYMIEADRNSNILIKNKI